MLVFLNPGKQKIYRHARLVKRDYRERNNLKLTYVNDEFLIVFGMHQDDFGKNSFCAVTEEWVTPTD